MVIISTNISIQYNGTKINGALVWYGEILSNRKLDPLLRLDPIQIKKLMPRKYYGMSYYYSFVSSSYVTPTPMFGMNSENKRSTTNAIQRIMLINMCSPR